MFNLQAMSFLGKFTFDYPYATIGKSLLIHADCFGWMGRLPKSLVHGIVTDPPYGLKEFNVDQLEKRGNGNGGIWRIPPSFDGSKRQPLPRFTALNDDDRRQLFRFFREWGVLCGHALLPGGHVFIACNSYLCQLVYSALVDGGLEFRGQIIRVVRTLRGGDRPKNAENEFPGVCSLPRGNYEPWGIFRKPMPAGMKVSECLKEFNTGGLRRLPEGLPFNDLILSERTPKAERDIANHPSVKPQSFLREVVYSILPLGKGIILDPFMGSGSTIAAAEALGLTAIGIEKNQQYYQTAKNSASRLSRVKVARDQINFAFG